MSGRSLALPFQFARNPIGDSFIKIEDKIGDNEDHDERKDAVIDVRRDGIVGVAEEISQGHE